MLCIGIMLEHHHSQPGVIVKQTQIHLQSDITLFPRSSLRPVSLGTVVTRFSQRQKIMISID